jgi:PAS domain S-box-containing protein
MQDPSGFTGWPSEQPSPAELPSHRSDLLPTWDAPGTMSGIANFDGYIIAVNDRCEQLLGWTPAQLMSAPYWEFQHPGDQGSVPEPAEGLTNFGGDAAGVEVRMLRRDGTGLWTRWQTALDPLGNQFYAVGVDISDEMPPVKRRVHVGTWVRDVAAGTVLWSDEIYDMFGLRVGTALDDDLIKAHINPQDHPLVAGAWRASIADQDAHSAVYRVIRPDGTTRTLRSTGRVTARAHGLPLRVRGLTVDITDRLPGVTDPTSAQADRPGRPPCGTKP